MAPAVPAAVTSAVADVPMSDPMSRPRAAETVWVVAPDRTVADGSGTYGPGESVELSEDEARWLYAHGFVVRA